MATFVGVGESGVTHDVFAYAADGTVWNGSSFVAWVNGSFATYRVTATEQGTSGRFYATLPANTYQWELRVRAGTLADSEVVWAENVDRVDEILDELAELQTALEVGETVYTLYITSGDGRRASGATVSISTDEAGTNVIAAGVADSTGKLALPLPDGTLYVWARHSKFTFDNPTEITIPEA